MKSRNELVEKGLRSIDPLVGEEIDRLSSDADDLLASIVATDPGEPIRSQRISRRVSPKLGRPRVLAVIPLTAALLVALIAGLPGSHGGDSTLPALARVAQAAAAQAPPRTNLPYLYMKTREIRTDTTAAHGQAWSVLRSTTREEWIAEDGSGQVRTVDFPPRWLGPKNREAWEAAGSIDFLAYGWSRSTHEEDMPAGYFDDSLFDGVGLSELPTDPTELAAWLEHRVSDPKADAGAGNGFPIPVKVLTLVGDLLNFPLAPPELRAALYEAAGQIPGIEYLGETTDELGRRGVAVGAESASSGAPTLYSLIFDSKTSQVLATEEKILKAPAALPDEGYPLTLTTLFLDSSSTSSLGSRP